MSIMDVHCTDWKVDGTMYTFNEPDFNIVCSTWLILLVFIQYPNINITLLLYCD